MMGLSRLTATLLLLLLLLSLASAAASPAQQRLLGSHYDDGSEMGVAIIRDYLEGEECQRRCASMGEGTLRASFEQFRAGWVERMVNFVIG